MENEELRRCVKCGRVFTDEDIYVKIKGSVFIGEDKGIIGGNENSASYFCAHCLIDDLQGFKELDENNLKSRIETLQNHLDHSTGKCAEKSKESIDIPVFLEK